MMSKIRSRDNVTEVAFRRLLWARGLRYRLHRRDLPGRPDLIFSSCKVVVFVDGDFWHGRTLVEEGEEALRANFRTARQEWWVEKITRNAMRDLKVSLELQVMGWTVIRIWESDLIANMPHEVERLVSLLHTA